MPKKPIFSVISGGASTSSAPALGDQPTGIDLTNFDVLEGQPEAYRQEREQLHQRLFPGDPERARTLGAAYERLNTLILATFLPLREQDRAQLQAALRPIASLVTGRAPLHARALLSRPLKLWADRDKAEKQNPAQFTRQVYADWIGNGLTRKQLRELDPQLYHALSVWEHRHPEDTITELPTLGQIIDQRIASLSDEFTPEELRKLGSTLQTRHRRSKK